MENNEVKNVEYYRCHCGAAGIMLAFADGCKHLINAYDNQTVYNCMECTHWYGCPFEQAQSVDYKCGWEEAEELLDWYTSEPAKQLTNEELDELISRFN